MDTLTVVKLSSYVHYKVYYVGLTITYMLYKDDQLKQFVTDKNM